tara:strand:- start:3447 stop:4691 length:1245 start_codon:yes stop_codon:yes gene_type:complete
MNISYNIREFVLVSLIYTSLILSTSYHTATTPPDDTFEPAAYHVATSAEDDGNPIFAEHFSDFAIIYKKFFNDGWTDNFHPRVMTGMNDLWKSSGTWGDSGYYLIHTGYYAGLIERPDDDIPNQNKTHTVYKYRWMVPFLVGNIYKSINYLNISEGQIYDQWNNKSISRLVYIWLCINFIAIFLTSLILFYYLKNIFKFTPLISLIGGIFFITSLIIVRTSNFPMSEPFACLITIILFFTLYYKKYFYYICVSFIGIASRDIFLFSSVLLFFNINFKDKQDLLRGILLSALPAIFYLFQRFYLNESISFEITMGRDLLKDPFVIQGLVIFTNIDNFIYFILRLSLTFGVLWLGIYHIRRNNFLFKSSTAILFLILINLLFVGNGSGITRHVGVMFPIIIPLFLYFIQDQLNFKG